MTDNLEFIDFGFPPWWRFCAGLGGFELLGSLRGRGFGRDAGFIVCTCGAAIEHVPKLC